MLGGMRSILLQTTLKWPPFQGYSVKKEAVRRLYNKMFTPQGFRYENLELQSETPTLSTRHGSGHSICRFGQDFLTIEEKASENTAIEPFVEIVRTVLSGLERDDVPLFFLQQCKQQSLAQPANARTPLELLAKRMSRVYEAVEPFERPPSHFGLRFQFEPVMIVADEDRSPANIADAHLHEEVAGNELTTNDSTPDGAGIRACDGFITVRFETYEKDLSQVWMEATASYLQTEQPLRHTELDRITSNILSTYTFLTDKCKRFLDQFDVNQVEETDGED
jgi:hypothetical protein